VKYIHFNNGKGGGVASVIRNLVEYSQDSAVEHHIIYTINQEEQTEFVPTAIKGTRTVSVFYYSPKWNFFYTCEKLAELIVERDAVLIAHDWLELGMVGQLGLQNTVVMFLHGDYPYYYELAIKHSDEVNAFICVSDKIRRSLIEKLPSRLDDIHCLNFPVPDLAPSGVPKQGNSIVFIGRCETAKGYHLLPVIDDKLKATGLDFSWHIYGEASPDKNVKDGWSSSSDVHFHGLVPNSILLQELPAYDYLILPSAAEGMPVTVIEAMKAGVVPVVNQLDSGVQELTGDSERGFMVKDNAVDGYVTVLRTMSQSPDVVKEISSKASQFAREQFEPFKCTLMIQNLIGRYAAVINDRKSKKKYGSRLDQKYLPNVLVHFIRSRQQ